MCELLFLVWRYAKQTNTCNWQGEELPTGQPTVGRFCADWAVDRWSVSSIGPPLRLQILVGKQCVSQGMRILAERSNGERI
ncbi:uncharacterized protein BO72DRAFT_449591 [Aspergillus fijiensis CBS 313.89]|uniref:Uncharacterized protein n=1 Tax=Aspergillus fijiensis CBS 313.89 TaxID=1448319 RepID=A0A8G1VXP9_9EURO|nr:uncharacterized protein BO72DRAFT_449591 [Aspergillus fijiensis CBS 313.89]RAK75618.1 hypothetical protein BO72DRAFT_449591 [Aspergillus fijiensis CBS 313.89]